MRNKHFLIVIYLTGKRRYECCAHL
jgi:hypothetical protein